MHPRFMIHRKKLLFPLGVLATAGCFAPLLRAATLDWTGASGTDSNWATPGNWSPAGPPGAADSARFFDLGAGIPSTVAANRSILSLTYGQTNGTHTTLIDTGRTLTLSGADAGGNVLYVGTDGQVDPDTVVNAAFLGEGTLNLANPTGNLAIRQPHGTANNTRRAVLDLSGLATFTSDIGRVLVGQGTGGTFNRNMGTLILARTNHIALKGAAPQLLVGDNSSNNNGNGSISYLTLGQETTLSADSIRVGGQKQQGNMSFSAAFFAPSLKLRGTDGVGRMTLIGFGDNGAQGGSGNPTTGTINLGDGTVDILADTIYLGRGQSSSGGGGATGNMTVGAGLLDVNTFEIGYQNAANAVGVVSGTLNVNNNALFGSGATVSVNTSLRLARNAGSTAAVNGTLNIAGGTVRANELVPGGGNSVLNITQGGTLVVSNSVGGLESGLSSFTANDAVLRLPVKGASPVIITTNLDAQLGTIHITELPAVPAYPADFVLVSYQTGSGAGFQLGTLPAGNPAFVGSIVDTGNSVVLRLTGGLVTDLNATWTAATDGNWDDTTLNWKNTAQTPVAFPVNGQARFDDTAATGNVTLVGPVGPASVSVNNTALNYVFGGDGYVAGAGSLTKDGPGSLVLANGGVNLFGHVAVKQGTFRLGDGGANGQLSTLAITNNAALVVDQSGDLALNAALHGTGTWTKTGSGTLTLSGTSSASGPTALNGGSLVLGPNFTGSGAITTAAGTTLGLGLAANDFVTVNGPLTVGGRLAVGGSGTIGFNTVANTLTVSAGGELAFDVDVGNGLADSLTVAGNLVLNNTTLAVTLSELPPVGTEYLLLTYTGTLSGSFNPVVSGTHYSVSVDTSVAGQVKVKFNGGSGAAMQWISTANGAWDATSLNWKNLDNGQTDRFFNGDTALLDDTAGVVTDLTLAAGTTVSPTGITNNSANNHFTIGGGGAIGGTGGIVKLGASTLTLASANSFAGDVLVQQGVLRVGHNTALGNTTGGTIITNQGSLDLGGPGLAANSLNLNVEPFILSGAGADGQGVIINSGPVAQQNAIRTATLVGDTTFGGPGDFTAAGNPGRWDFRGSGAALSSQGQPFKITKVGGNQVSFVGVNFDAGIGDIDVQAGELSFETTTTSMGDPTKSLTVRAGATLQIWASATQWNKLFTFMGDGVATTFRNGSGNNTLVGPVTLVGDCLFDVGGTSLTISSPTLGGTGGFVKNGAGIVHFGVASTHTGITTVNGGTLALTGLGALGQSRLVTIAANAILDAVPRDADDRLTLGAGQTLQGNGTLSGELAASAGATVSPGVAAIGRLTVTGSVTLSGTNQMELDPATGTNDLLVSSASIAYGGVLRVANLGGPLPAGSIKLFEAPAYSGAFGAIEPATPGAGQTWDTTALATSGVLKVVGDPAVTNPSQIGGIVVADGSAIINGTGGTPNAAYSLLTSTNIALPLIDWTLLGTGTFDATGAFRITNTVAPGTPQRFFLIRQP